MRFFDILGNLKGSRRFVSGAANVQDEEVKDPVKLAEILRNLMRRISDAESSISPEAQEYELEVGTAGLLTSINHNLNCSVRYTVVFWTKTRSGGYPTAGPALVAQETSTDNTLDLRSYSAGRAIIRIEPSFKGVSYNG